jgi:predicted CxxxxCH...CXXCH cytochrome family protein
MEIKMKYIYLFIPVLIFGLYLTGCAELEPDIAQPEEVGDFHKEGILNPMSSNWHGDLIRENHWDMKECQQCHGGDYNNGLVEASCLTCHTDPAGPENCATCHGNETSPAPPEDLDGNTATTFAGVGAHRIHLSGGTLGKQVSCADCHRVPASMYDEGHVDTELPAEVPMNGYLATIITNETSTSSYNPGLPLFNPDPEYNFTNMTCSNVYCHGYFKNGNLDNTVGWTGPDAAACGTCHGDPSAPTLFEKALPGGEHPQIQPGGLNCSFCHGGTVDDNLRIISPSKHIDGMLNLRQLDGSFKDVDF